MVEKRIPLPVAEAIKRVIDRASIGETEHIPLNQTDGRYLAEPIKADHPIPYFDRSAFDGYAIRSTDTVQASFDQPVELKVIESIGAGHVATHSVGQNEAIRIMTGAQIPNGADAILALELSEPIQKESETETWVRVNRPIQKGTHISYKGEDTAEGALLAQEGRRISAGEKSMLATFGYHTVQVFKQPIVGLFVTGTELLPVEAPLAPGKIRNSNSFMLESQIAALGGRPKYYGILTDDYEQCYQAVKEALSEVDFLITTGGASVGDFDHVQDLLTDLGADVLFNKVAMRPGSVTTIGQLDNKWIFGLSGNPAACYVGFELFVRPVLKTYMGSVYPHLPRSKAILQHAINKPNRFSRFIRAKAEIVGCKVTVQTVGVDKSGVASALIDANVLLHLPPSQHQLPEGEEVEVLWLERPIEGTMKDES